MMNKRIIMAVAVIVNAAIGATAFAAIKIAKKDVAKLVSWLQATGKDREDFNLENAVLIGLKQGEAKSKARGAPGKEGEPFRFLHLFSKGNKPSFLVVMKGSEDKTMNEATDYKIELGGKITKAFWIKGKLDESGNPIEGSSESKGLPLDKETQKAAAEEIAFWMARMQKDELAKSAPRQAGEVKP